MVLFSAKVGREDPCLASGFPELQEGGWGWPGRSRHAEREPALPPVAGQAFVGAPVSRASTRRVRDPDPHRPLFVSARLI